MNKIKPHSYLYTDIQFTLIGTVRIHREQLERKRIF